MDKFKKGISENKTKTNVADDTKKNNDNSFPADKDMHKLMDMIIESNIITGNHGNHNRWAKDLKKAPINNTIESSEHENDAIRDQIKPHRHNLTPEEIESLIKESIKLCEAYKVRHESSESKSDTQKDDWNEAEIKNAMKSGLITKTQAENLLKGQNENNKAAESSDLKEESVAVGKDNKDF